MHGQGDGVPKAGAQQAAAAREGPEPACVRAPFVPRVAHAGAKDELTSCRGTVKSAWQYLQWVAKEGEPAQKGQVVATWYGDDSLHLSLPNSQPCIGGSKGTRQGNRQGW